MTEVPEVTGRKSFPRTFGESELQPSQDLPHSVPAPAPEKGWSKWKNKVKTFFQKLFG
jgi:hypothetical protein